MKLKFKQRIASQFIVYILLFSMLITVVFTGAQLYYDYKTGMAQIHNKFQLIKQSYLRSIAESVWEYDYEVLQIQVNGIAKISDVQSIRVTVNDKIVASSSNEAYDYVISKQIPITYNSNNQLQNLGSLTVVFSLKNLHLSLLKKLFYTALEHLSKTFLVSFFIFYIFYWLIGKHLLKIVEYAKNITSDTLHLPLTLDKQVQEENSEDEIDQLVVALNEMRENFVSHKSELEYQAYHDPLTNLPNRALLLDRLEQSFEDAKRYGNKVALLFIDIDHFKHINDTFGHKFGDEILLEVANRFKSSIRSVDTLSRLGGDEFVVLTSIGSHGYDASELANKLLSSMTESIIVENESFNIGLSIGISIYPDDTHSTFDLLRNADSAMYKAKSSGRNNFQYYSLQLTEEAEKRVILKNEINEALKNNEFVVYFQPQINAETHQITGAEALVRWIHPSKGFIAPDEFIPFAEQNGQIHLIDLWVLDYTTQFISRYFSEATPSFKIAVNFSSQTIERNLLSDDISKIVKTNKCHQQAIEIEITESNIFKNRDHCIEELNRLSELGFSIAIDDFGTGYSSLSHLKQLPINKLKIDRSFINDLSDNEDDGTIVKTIIALGKNLGMSVIAEGVETEQQQHFLIASGCLLVQGYFYSKPLSGDDFLKYYERYKPDAKTHKKV